MIGRLRKNKESGVSLLETVISMGILAVGLLGMATLQITAIRSNGSAMQRTLASAYAEQQIETYTNTPYADIPVGTSTDPIQSGLSRVVTVEQDVPINDTKRVTVEVTWRDITPHKVTFRTLIAKP